MSAGHFAVKEKNMNKFFSKLPFKGLAEKIPAETRAKVPLLNKAIPFANQIACGLIMVLAIVIIACSGKGGSSGGGSSNASAAIKGSGKNYTMSKDSDFKYDLTKIDGQDYVVITGINIPEGFKLPEAGSKTAVGSNASVGSNYVIIDTMTVKIPEKIEGYTVGAIGKAVLQNGYSVTSVTIPDTVMEIGSYAFSGTYISSIKLPKNLKKMGGWAFNSCEYLVGSITLPGGLTEIPAGAFKETKITEVIIPDSVTVIGDQAFYFCTELTSIKFPSHPIQYMFWDYDKLVPPDNREWSDTADEKHMAFLGCSKLSLAARNSIQESGYKGKFQF